MALFSLYFCNGCHAAVCRSSEVKDQYKVTTTLPQCTDADPRRPFVFSLSLHLRSATSCFTVTRSSICWGIRRADHTNIRGSAAGTQDGASSQLICWQGPPGAPERNRGAAGWGRGRTHRGRGDFSRRVHTLITRTKSGQISLWSVAVKWSFPEIKILNYWRIHANKSSIISHVRTRLRFLHFKRLGILRAGPKQSKNRQKTTEK